MATATTNTPTTRPCRACNHGTVTSHTGVRRACGACHGTGRL